MLKVAINGFGRIGRMFFRAWLERRLSEMIDIVAINDIGEWKTLVHLLMYDSVHGKLSIEVSYDEAMQSLIVGEHKIALLSEENVQKLPWRSLDVDYVIEATGRRKARKLLQEHINAGSKKVIVSTIIPDADFTVIFGVNHHRIEKEHSILSNGSCTSNCLLTTIAPIYQNFGIQAANATSIHSYTSDQSIVDTSHSDLRRARAVANSIIPSTTNASKAVELVFPQLKDKIYCSAARVPITNISMLEIHLVMEKVVDISQINSTLIEASGSTLLDVISYSNKELVSVDFIHEPYSAVIDITQTHVINGKLCKIVAWYDNEWGYSNRILDVLCYLFSRF